MMQDKEKRQKLLNEALNEIDESMIEDAARIRKSKKIRWIPLAAAALLVLIGAIVLPNVINRGAKNAEELLTRETEKAVTTAAPEDGHHAGGTSAATDAAFHFSPEEYLTSEGKEYSAGSHLSSDIHGITDGFEDERDEAKNGVDTVIAEEPAADPAEDPMMEPVIEPVIEPTEKTEASVPDPGQLTAGAWNDNDHFTLWKALFKKEEQGSTAGKFVPYTSAENRWFSNLLNRITVKVVNGSEPVAGRKVRITGENEGKPGITTAVTDANGVAYLFCDVSFPLEIGIEIEGVTATLTTNDYETVFDLTHLSDWGGRDVSSLKDNVIELMYVIDATGSMGDELSYLKSELSDVVQKVVAANPGVTVRLSFLTYRDDGDEEKFHFEDFVNVSDEAGMKAILHQLSLQDPTGGDDYEEAVDEALELALTKNWSAASTKLIFHVLDAPAHDTAEHRARYESAVKTAAEKGIRICPILSSGSDTETEYLSRAEAVLTGGTFIFLTDDSGIGFGHLDPQLPDAVHEYLNACMIRLINGYYTGEFAEPVAWNAE